MTYQQIDEVVRRALSDVVTPLRQDLALFRVQQDKMSEQINRLQQTSVTEARLADFVQKSVADEQHKAIEARLKAIEGHDRDEYQAKNARDLQIMYITITVAVGILTLLAGGILSHLVFK